MLNAKEKLELRKYFLILLQNLRFLVRQNLPLCGKEVDEADSNLMQLLKLRGVDKINIPKLLSEKSRKFTLANVQNEVAKIMAQMVLKNIAKSLHNNDSSTGSAFYALAINKVSDSYDQEHLVICCRWCDGNFCVHEEFVGIYQIQEMNVDCINAYQDVLSKMNLSFQYLRGQCYNGINDEVKNAVVKGLSDLDSRAPLTQCNGQPLNLTCIDSIKKCPLMRTTLETAYEVVKLLEKAMMPGNGLSIDEALPTRYDVGVRVLDSNGLVVKFGTLGFIQRNYNVLQETWKTAVDIQKNPQMKARIMAVLHQMQKFGFYFGLALGNLLLKHIDILSKTLQKPDMSALEGKEVADSTVTTLHSLRNETSFQLFWAGVTEDAKRIDLDESSFERRKKKVCRKNNSVDDTNEAHYQHIYTEVLDLIISCIENRFHQPGFKCYANGQELLLKAINGIDYSEELNSVTSTYGCDLKPSLLDIQLKTFAANFPKRENKATMSDIIQLMRSMGEPQKELLSEICTLLKLILVMPADTSALSKRSRMSLDRVKHYLTTPSMQEVDELNDRMLLHVHKEYTDRLCLVDAANEFVRNSEEHRYTLFGLFQDDDLRS